MKLILHGLWTGVQFAAIGFVAGAIFLGISADPPYIIGGPIALTVIGFVIGFASVFPDPFHHYTAN